MEAEPAQHDQPESFKGAMSNCSSGETTGEAPDAALVSHGGVTDARLVQLKRGTTTSSGVISVLIVAGAKNITHLPSERDK